MGVNGFRIVAQVNDVDEDDVIKASVGDKEVAIYNVEGEFFATELMCTHEAFPLDGGYCEDGKVECPLHSGWFDIKTGKALSAPCIVDLKIYDVKVDGNNILICLD